ncbi:hypothetical protein DUNSADRAFT_11622 [Dunaliella salina]|uniref:Encoded protein n=1 Tax=Dunaliella salina TaxID=3046 RepID=A0ABQ7GCY6_DUNSA|nr:hypothetical protein DUNSADRAFT_11622 [Dunaliella salina]|eukprot:KAF5832455.1 hypothetical protein DUNSADRAFT_11622 [Dunaliella salina]
MACHPWPGLQHPCQAPQGDVLVRHGKFLFDWSQVLAVTNAGPWRPVLLQAIQNFKASGALEADIRAALKNHFRSEELDLDLDLGLGPDPKPPVY